MILRIALVAALFTSGCTLDYEGLADPAGEGGAAATSTGAGTSTATSTSAATGTVTGATTASTSQASSGAGAGGAGEGGSGSAGGASGGGGLPGEEPCDGLGLTFAEDVPQSLGSIWDIRGGTDADLASGDGQLLVTMSDGERGGILTIDALLDGCSVTVSLLGIDPAEPADGELTVAGISNDEIGVLVEVGGGKDTPFCRLRVGAIDAGGEEGSPCLEDAPAHDLRIRHTGTALCFDAGPVGGALEPIGECVAVDGPERVLIGATSTNDAVAAFGEVR